MSRVRINKSNRDTIESFIIDSLNGIVRKTNSDFIGLPTLWGLQFELQDKFNISDEASQKITWKVIGNNKKESKNDV